MLIQIHMLECAATLPRITGHNTITNHLHASIIGLACGWSGGAMVLGKLPVPGRPTVWMIVGQGSTALVVVAGGVVWTYLLSSIFSLLFLPLYGRRLDIDWNTVSKSR